MMNFNNNLNNSSLLVPGHIQDAIDHSAKNNGVDTDVVVGLLELLMKGTVTCQNYTKENILSGASKGRMELVPSSPYKNGKTVLVTPEAFALMEAMQTTSNDPFWFSLKVDKYSFDLKKHLEYLKQSLPNSPRGVQMQAQKPDEHVEDMSALAAQRGIIIPEMTNLKASKECMKCNKQVKRVPGFPTKKGDETTYETFPLCLICTDSCSAWDNICARRGFKSKVYGTGKARKLVVTAVLNNVPAPAQPIVQQPVSVPQQQHFVQQPVVEQPRSTLDLSPFTLDQLQAVLPTVSGFEQLLVSAEIQRRQSIAGNDLLAKLNAIPKVAPSVNSNNDEVDGTPVATGSNKRQTRRR